jgi:uncharacterized protein (TIGR00299 family) protein
VTVAWVDASAGASGDMLLGALVGAGADLAVLQAAVDALGTEPVRLTASSVTRAGLAATKVDVTAPASDVRRTWPGVRELLEGAGLAAPVRDLALDVFGRLARAEAAAHGIPADEVHFHEVGALDSLADVVGVCAALHDLAVSAVHCTPVALGQGSVRTEHGLLPVPGPAVLAVLAEAGAPVGSGDVEGEACTPTGAALLAATVTGWGGLPGLRISATGTGAGSRDSEGRPNVLRVVLGEPVTSEGDGGDAVVLEANVDDLDPRVWPGVLTALLAAGASDAWLTPILMKKGRPAHTLSALAPPQVVDAVRRVMFTESSTIGVREHRVGKRALARETRTVRVDGAEVRVKVALLDGQVVNASPEYDDVAAAALALGRPVKAVLAAAAAAAQADLV